jgi:putative phosphotransacetylase
MYTEKSKDRFQTSVHLVENKQPLIEVSVGVSGRHVHITQEHVEILFGAGHRLTPFRALSQPGQFACVECVTLKTEKGVIEGVRILGPARRETQVEVALTDVFRLKLEAVPVRMSGKIAGSPGLTLIGPAGEVKLTEGVIISQRHLHMTPQDAEKFGLRDKDIVSVACGSYRQVIFGNVIVRVRDDFKLDFHIDTDEANAAGVKTGDKGYLLMNLDLTAFTF